jgi:inorganic pyrophosphatase
MTPHRRHRSATEVTVVVEIPRGGRAKFEIDPATGTVWLDRVLSTSTQYPAEYGFVRHTSSGDGDPLDAVVLVEERTVPGCHVRARPIGVLAMTDEAGPDSKILCVALGDPSMGTYSDIDDVAPHLLDEIEHFFRVYKQLEPHKSVAVGDWRGAADAERLVRECTARYHDQSRTMNDTDHEHDTHPEHDTQNDTSRKTITRTEAHAMNIELDDAQAELLREVLDSVFRDLRYEIADTDNYNFRQGLKEREATLVSIMSMVGGPLPDRS